MHLGKPVDSHRWKFDRGSAPVRLMRAVGRVKAETVAVRLLGATWEDRGFSPLLPRWNGSWVGSLHVLS